VLLPGTASSLRCRRFLSAIANPQSQKNKR
jgi:hypothetical protein